MKKNLPSFLAGIATTVALMSVTVTALAATGQLTIAIDPIDVQVNGAVFQPVDAKGNKVMTFAYDGTTYAPLRALAEVYGLEVGYDADKNMATVGAVTETPPETTTPPDYSDWSAEDEAAYQEFKGMWVLDEGQPSVAVVEPLPKSSRVHRFKLVLMDYAPR